MSADRDASNSTKVTNKTLNVLLIREYGEMDQQVEKLFDRDVWKISYAQDNKTALELATARAFDRLQPYQNTREIWCRRRESNPRPRDYETLALPLSYAGTRQFPIVRTIRGECQADERAFKDQQADDSTARKNGSGTGK